MTSLSIVNIPGMNTSSTLAVKGKWVGVVIIIDGDEIGTLKSHLMKYHCRGHHENWYGK